MPISAPKIPDGLPELMRGLAKSVIKENPENLYVHAAEYFENLIRERDGELDRGYQGFNAYQVYADYKEQTREKLGLAPTKQPSGSDGEDAGDTGSGDSGSRSRGRRRRRTRNQPSTEKDSSVPVAVKPDTGEVAKQKSLSEDSVEPVSVVEDEVLKVHYNPPEAAPPGRVVSAQSVEAEQAVLTVLEDDQILDSDGKDTAEEDDPVERADDDDIGTAPSTAEITEEAAPAEPSLANEEIPLQDLETCFMYANVEHSEDIAEGVVSDLKKADVAKDPKDEAPQPEAERPGSANPSSPQQQSLEEVVEEPCIKREVSPSKTLPPAEKEESIDRSKDQELEEIKKVDLSQLSKDSAEALFYSLKKSALENQDPEGSAESGEAPKSRDSNGGDDDDDDVVVTEEPPEVTAPEDTAKRTFTDDFLDENPPAEAEAPSDAPVDTPEVAGPAKKLSEGSTENEDDLSPMQTASMRLKQFQDAMHGRADSAEGEGEAASAKRPVMRRCMTEMAELQRYVSADESADPSYVEEEDQFDGYYIGHIKNKILASSVSVADSDCCDPARGSSGDSGDENNVRTALETIASTDTESTIASQATIQQAGKRSYLQKHPQNTSSNIPYASFGNAAIDKSLDEFIEREERNKQDEAFAEAATKIQRSYRTHKKRLLRDYHSTMRTCTEDASAESGGEEASNVIQIKLDQKRATDLGPLPSDGEEESPDPGAGSLHVPPRGRPMQSLNIDEYDTVTRRQMLTRGVAMQRNSTPDDDSGKSTNASTDRRSSLSGGGGAGGGPVASDSPPEGEEQPSADPTAVATSGSSDDGDHKSPGSKPPGDSERDREAAALKGLARSSSTGQRAPVDVQSLLLMARQRTMPVQIDSSVIRVLPKHMRKRISSADLPNGGKRK
ncbi:uncharacterized protein LOC131211814 [Anopheles bellator]|uniref:uncharacterized protein LOC131211814 n=1 Tax=Anopheles bellator TaxID=139047 RepID=UPI0026476350|nr:uncharacterized protein LOC131211814 [Anopheles bellator]